MHLSMVNHRSASVSRYNMESSALRSTLPSNPSDTGFPHPHCLHTHHTYSWHFPLSVQVRLPDISLCPHHISDKPDSDRPVAILRFQYLPVYCLWLSLPLRCDT